MTSLSTSRRTALAMALAAAAGTLASPWAAAQSWPSRPVKLVVPFPPGGATDTVARLIGERLATRLGQAVIIENKPGAATVIGVDAVAKASPDGYTLLVSGSSSFTVVPGLRSKLPFDVLKDLAPIALVANAPLVVVTSASKPYQRLSDVIAQAKAHPKALTYSTYGPGTAGHLAGELLANAAGLELEPVPYKGSAEALIGVMRGDVDLAWETLSAASPHLKSGKLRVLAVAGAKRTAFLPEAPAMDELRLPQAAFEGFYAVAAPAATPPAVLQRLTREISEIVALPEVKEKWASLSLEAVAWGPDTLRTVMKTDIARFRELGQRIKINLD
ncbi:MAG TPA: tripartite tricarboxylate transporter substrate-binding protein [Burkholderiaceae bacterium]|nr:tripartite tricarboxylate transporter substrate-binding protein [Burkholderiaceae bacterium]